jgi:hypothetical protein
MVVSLDKYLVLQTTCQEVTWQVRLLQDLCHSHLPFRECVKIKFISYLIFTMLEPQN